MTFRFLLEHLFKLEEGWVDFLSHGAVCVSFRDKLDTRTTHLLGVTPKISSYFCLPSQLHSPGVESHRTRRCNALARRIPSQPLPTTPTALEILRPESSANELIPSNFRIAHEGPRPGMSLGGNEIGST